MTTWLPTRPDPRVAARLRNLDLRRDLQEQGFTQVAVARRARWRAVERALHEEVVLTPNDGSNSALASLQEESKRSLREFDSVQRVVVYASS